MSNPIRVIVVGCGNMGASHARAYHKLDGFEIAGLVSRSASKEKLNAEFDNAYPLYDSYEDALANANTGFDTTQPARKFHAILVDIDHSPNALLDARSACFYAPEGFARVANQLHARGIFGL